LKERYIFIGRDAPDPVDVEYWKARGIVPIHYDDGDEHAVLLKTLERWAVLSVHNGKQGQVAREIQRLVARPRSAATDSDRDLFDHLFRRASPTERVKLARDASEASAAFDWLRAIRAVSRERRQ
jgi:hypothetical protein